MSVHQCTACTNDEGDFEMVEVIYYDKYLHGAVDEKRYTEKFKVGGREIKKIYACPKCGCLFIENNNNPK